MPTTRLTPLRRASPHGIAEALLLAIISTSGLYYLIILPVFVSQLQLRFHLTPVHAGMITSVNAYAGVLSAIAVSIRIRAIPWRRVLPFALLVIAACEALTPFAPSDPALLAIRAVHGIGSGIATALVASLLGRTRLPDRSYAIMLVYQALVSGAALALIPRFAATLPEGATFHLLAIATGAAIALVPLLPDTEAPVPTGKTQAQPETLRVVVIAAVAAVYLYQAAHTALNAYTLALGGALGLGETSAASGAGIGQTLGLSGAVVAIAMGLRFGRVMPLALIVPVALAEGLLLACARGSPLVWTTAQLVDGVLTFYALPWLLGTCAATSPGGPQAVWGGIGSKLGLASGPALGGATILAAGYGGLVAFGIAGMAIAGVLAVAAALGIARRASSGALT